LLLLLLPVCFAGKVIKGWDTGVASMKKGELANLVCR
jgi:FKBP-type peptidyl-prolyl cis-trans isomerase